MPAPVTGIIIGAYQSPEIISKIMGHFSGAGLRSMITSAATTVPSKLYLTLILCCGLLNGCGNSNSNSNISAADISLEPPAVEDIILEEYRIGVSDTLSINVWKNPDLSTEVVVLPDGSISVPLVGDLRAAGSTTTSLAQGIKSALNEFIREPEVTVSVTAAASSEYLQRVRITGAVNTPISINYHRGLTVLDVVLLAGGLTPFANGNKSTLFRRADGEVNVYAVHLEDILSKGKLATNYPVLPSDVISVPEKSF